MGGIRDTKEKHLRDVETVYGNDVTERLQPRKKGETVLSLSFLVGTDKTLN